MDFPLKVVVFHCYVKFQRVCFIFPFVISVCGDPKKNFEWGSEKEWTCFRHFSAISGQHLTGRSCGSMCVYVRIVFLWAAEYYKDPHLKSEDQISGCQDCDCCGPELGFIPSLGMVRMEISITRILMMGCMPQAIYSYIHLCILYHVLACFDRGTDGQDWPLDKILNF